MSNIQIETKSVYNSRMGNFVDVIKNTKKEVDGKMVYHSLGDMPSYVPDSGCSVWHYEGRRHRLDAPAVVGCPDRIEYYIQGALMSKEVFDICMKDEECENWFAKDVWRKHYYQKVFINSRTHNGHHYVVIVIGKYKASYIDGVKQEDTIEINGTRLTMTQFNEIISKINDTSVMEADVCGIKIRKP